MRWLLPLLVACGASDAPPSASSPDDEVPRPTLSTPPPPVTATLPTTVPEGCAAITALAAAPGAQVVNEVVLDVTLDEAAATFAVCTAGDDPADTLLAEAPADTATTLSVVGLRPDVPYTCEVAVVDCPEVVASVEHTAPIPQGVPRFEVEQDPNVAMDGVFTAFNSQVNAFSSQMAWAVVVDPDGRVRWAYPVGSQLIADIDVTVIDRDTVHVGGGWGIGDFGQPNQGVFRTVDLSGTPLVERTVPAVGFGFNHHSEPLADGTYLSLTFSLNSAGPQEWLGVGAEHWDPAQGLLWSWDSQQLIDAGQLEPPSSWDSSPYHANSITFATDPAGDAVWISLYADQSLWRLDRATGDRTHRVGPGSDFVLLDLDGNELPASEWFYVQHSPDYTPDGRVLLYDNGYRRPGGGYSRVAEYRLDLDARAATLLWSWTEPGWYNPIVGDADYLPGGHVLVTRGFSRDWSPGSSDVSQVLELDPVTGTVVWRLRWPTGAFITFRGQRVDGCGFLHSGKYCPETAARIEALRGG